MIDKNRTYSVFDLFAGAGGFSLGFSMANYNIDLCLEHDLWACDTLRENHANSKIVHEDIRYFDSKEKIMKLGLETPDVIIGGPPCQGFSNANSNSDINDPRNSLFKNFAFWVDALRPKIFVMENVSGILTKKNAEGKKVIDIIISTFQKSGYQINIWKLDAAAYGVPQHRERVFIVGNIFSKQIFPPNPTHGCQNKLINGLKPFITIGEAILDLPEIFAKGGKEIQQHQKSPNSEYQVWARSSDQKVFNHVAMKHTERSVKRFQMIQSGQILSNLPDELKVRKRNGEGELSASHFQSNYRHLRKDMVSYTIPASFYSNFIHPTIPRNITAREAARIQSFPDYYIFKGKRTLISSKLMSKLGKDEDYLSQYNQIGNAVPPLLSKAIAAHIRSILCNVESDVNELHLEC